MAFSPDGTRLATASRDRSSRVFALNVADLESIAGGRLTRALTQAECRTFLHMDACPVE